MSSLAQNGWIGSILTDTASKVATSIDNWTNPVPARLMMNPPDLWNGEAEAGRHICAGRFVIGDQHFQAAHGDVWSGMDNLQPVWRDHVLAFDFLPHLRACGADASRREARHHIARFLDKQSGRMEQMQVDVTARRFIQWLVHFDFYGSSADYQFQLEVRRSMAHQLRHLTKRETEAGLPRLTQAVALALGGIALEGQAAAFTLGRMWLDDCLRDFVKDNGVATRRPSDAIDTLTLLLTLRCTLLQAGMAVPESVKRAVDELSSGLRFLRGADKKLPVFQGGVSGNVARIEQLLKRSDSKGRVTGSAAMGYHKMVQGRTQIFMDCGALPSVDHDEKAHAAPLAFEMWVGRDRVFTQCGASPFLSDTAQRALRGTSAHSSLSIDDRNVCEIRAKGGLGRRYPAPHFQRWELDGGVMLDAWHQGYQDLFGLSHRRKLALLEDGECLAGEDEVVSEAELIRPHYVTLRFHLHPRVQASLIQNDTEVLLRLPGSGGWRFSTDGGTISLEESLYCGSGRPKPTQCITVTREMTEPSLSVSWAVQAELPS